MLKRLVELCPNNYFYYFDVSLDESLKRHSTKPNAHEFGEKELNERYRHLDLTNFTGEKIIPENYTIEQSVKMILEDSVL